MTAKHTKSTDYDFAQDTHQQASCNPIHNNPFCFHQQPTFRWNSLLKSFPITHTSPFIWWHFHLYLTMIEPENLNFPLLLSCYSPCPLFHSDSFTLFLCVLMTTLSPMFHAASSQLNCISSLCAQPSYHFITRVFYLTSQSISCLMISLLTQLHWISLL